MLLSNIPAKIAAIFAASGTKNTIPLTTAGVAHTNNASFDVGFPSITMTPVISGGLPPFGADFNGLMNMVTAIQQWQGAGGMFPYDLAFSTAIGGYPKGAMLLKATGLGRWQSTVDNNTSNPDTGGANWADLGAGFSGAFATNGYRVFPDGTIIQWGVLTISDSTGKSTVTFPIAFPNAALACVGYYKGAGTGSAPSSPVSVMGTPPTLTTFQTWTYSNGAFTSGTTPSFIAIGN